MIPVSEEERRLEAPVDILLVDDNPNNLLALEALLSDIGARFVKARSGADALKCLLEQDFALIILDIQMPDMDGFETAAMIRGRERSRRIPIIFLTAFNRSDTQVHKGYALGAVDFLFKPIVPEVLRSKVAVFADLFRKTEEVRRQADQLRSVERQMHERRLTEERQRWEASLLRQQIEQERRSNSYLHVLANFANQLLVVRDPRRFLGATFLEVSELFGLEVYNCYLVDGERLRLLGVSPGAESSTPQVCEFGSDLPGLVAQRREPVLLHDAASASEPALEPARRANLRAAVGYPLLVDGRLVGTLCFATRERDRIDDDAVEVVRIIADQTAIALERSRLVQELQNRAEALAEADRRKDEFLAMLAHELRNPLAPITSALKIFQLVETTQPQVVRARDAMERQVQHLVRIVDGLLDAARLTAGTIELHKESIDIAAVLQQAAQMSQPLIAEKHHKLDVTLPKDRLELFADPDRLAQIVVNLLDNAARYTDPGGQIELKARGEGDELVISVRDTGRGIKPELLQRIFGLFVQTPRNRELAQGGLGVGLTLVKRLTELHGGTITAHSAGEGHGSEFTVRLPLAVAPKAAPARPIPRFVPEGKSRHILIVDDNPDIRTTLADQLELLGHKVEVAATGQEGVDRVRESKPEIALVDISLPGLDGYGVARILRADPSVQTRLVAMTGYGQPEDRRRALDAGFFAHLVKPIDIDDLFRLLNK
jgi:signal transduction histidine kinase/DNA-binding response OmpR family regulator